MRQLLELIKERVEQLTGDELFHAPDGTLAPVQYYLLDRPAKRSDSNEYSDTPTCEIVPLSRTAKPSPGYTVRLIYLLHNKKRLDALDDLDLLQARVDLLAKATFPDYQLMEIANFWGDENTGIHWPPEYRLFYTLRFAGLPVRSNCEV